MKQRRLDPMTRPDRVLMGAIIGAHGVRGHVRIKSFAAAPKDIASYGPLADARGRAYKLTVKGGADDIVIAAIDWVTDRDQAEALKGTDLFVPRDALPAAEDGAFYHADLVGLEARLTDGTVFGTVRAVHDFGAGDSLEIARADGDVMVPFTSAAVPVVDVAGGFIVLDPPKGLLDK